MTYAFGIVLMNRFFGSKCKLLCCELRIHCSASSSYLVQQGEARGDGKELSGHRAAFIVSVGSFDTMCTLSKHRQFAMLLWH